MKLYIGADHRGFGLKEALKPWLATQGHDVVDCGNTSYDPEDDFPDFAFAVSDAVVNEPESRGIVICGSAGGVTMAANKVNGIRCSVGVTTDDVRHNRAHDDMNVLAVASDFTSEAQAREMILVFINTPFDGAERFVRRIQKIHSRE